MIKTPLSGDPNYLCVSVLHDGPPSRCHQVLPYLPGGDVFSHIESLPHGGGLDLAQATSYFRQMCEGLLHMKTTSRLAHHDVRYVSI